MTHQRIVSYWIYLKLLGGEAGGRALLDLQTGWRGPGDEPMREDELHFIVVHQLFKLYPSRVPRGADVPVAAAADAAAGRRRALRILAERMGIKS